MKKITFFMGVICAIAISAGTVGAFSVGSGTLEIDSLKVGKQGTGGVTYFNGTIANITTNENGGGIPVTFGDDVRIDGRVWRGLVQGNTDDMPFIIDDNVDINGALTVNEITGSIIGSGNIINGSIANDDLKNGSVNEEKIADSAVTNAKITNDAVTADKIADGAVGSDKISGQGGASLPIAYGYCRYDGTLLGGTSNVSCQYDSEQEIYIIPIEGQVYVEGEYVTVITPSSPMVMPYVADDNGDIGVSFSYDNDNMWTLGKTTSSFSFIVYKL